MATCWAAEENCCVHCKNSDVQQGFGPRTFLLCACCQDRGSHVECEEKATGTKVGPEALIAGTDWFCSQACKRISLGLSARTRQGRLPCPDDSAYSTELIKYSTDSRGSQLSTEAALRIFRSCFDPLEMDDGKELIQMVCNCYESPDDANEDDMHDFSNFRILMLRKHATVVTVATIRVFGDKFAEMPFIATKGGYRREGNCKRLLRVTEDILRGLHVQWLIVPSVKSLVSMWTNKFCFSSLTQEESDALEDRIVTPDTTSATMLKKKVYRTAAEAAAEAAATASKRRPGRPRKLQTPTQPIPRGKQQGAPQLRTTRQRRSTRAAMPQSPTHSGDLAADLAPGLLLDGDGEDSHAEHETNDPSFQPEVEEAELSNIAAIQQPTRTSSSPVTRTTTAEQDCGIMGGFVKTATDGDSGNRASGLSAVASELCTAKGCSARGVGSAGQPERATAAAQQVDDTSGHGVLAPGIPLPADWRVEIKTYPNGRSCKMFHAPNGKSYKSAQKAAEALGIVLPGQSTRKRKSAAQDVAGAPVAAAPAATTGQVHKETGQQPAAPQPAKKKRRPAATRLPPLPDQRRPGAPALLTPDIVKTKLELQASNAIADAIKTYMADAHVETQQVVQKQHAEIERLHLDNAQLQHRAQKAEAELSDLRALLSQLVAAAAPASLQHHLPAPAQPATEGHTPSCTPAPSTSVPAAQVQPPVVAASAASLPATGAKSHSCTPALSASTLATEARPTTCSADPAANACEGMVCTPSCVPACLATMPAGQSHSPLQPPVPSARMPAAAAVSPSHAPPLSPIVPAAECQSSVDHTTAAQSHSMASMHPYEADAATPVCRLQTDAQSVLPTLDHSLQVLRSSLQAANVPLSASTGTLQESGLESSQQRIPAASLSLSLIPTSQTRAECNTVSAVLLDASSSALPKQQLHTCSAGIADDPSCIDRLGSTQQKPLQQPLQLPATTVLPSSFDSPLCPKSDMTADYCDMQHSTPAAAEVHPAHEPMSVMGTCQISAGTSDQNKHLPVRPFDSKAFGDNVHLHICQRGLQPLQAPISPDNTPSLCSTPVKLQHQAAGQPGVQEVGPRMGQGPLSSLISKQLSVVAQPQQTAVPHITSPHIAAAESGRAESVVQLQACTAGHYVRLTEQPPLQSNLSLDAADRVSSKVTDVDSADQQAQGPQSSPGAEGPARPLEANVALDNSPALPLVTSGICSLLFMQSQEGADGSTQQSPSALSLFAHKYGTPVTTATALQLDTTCKNACTSSESNEGQPMVASLLGSSAIAEGVEVHSNRRLSAGTARRVHVAEELRQLMCSEIVEIGMGIGMDSSEVSDGSDPALALAMEEAGNWAGLD